MGLTPGIDTHLLHPSPGGVGSNNGYLLVRPTSNATTMPTPGANNNLSTTVIVSSISHIYSLPWMITVAVLLFLLVIVTIFGNFLVILALVKYRNLRSVSNYLIGNLAVSDFLLSVTILPMSAVDQCLGYWVFGEILCKFWLVADVLYCTASIWNLCIIAFDRFTATLYPLWYREKRTVKQGIVYIIIVWVLSFAICVPPLLGWNDFTQTFVYNNQTDSYACVLFQTKGYVVYSASGSFYIPFFITVFMYIRIFGVLRHRIRKMRAAAAKRTKQAKAASKKPCLPPGSSASSPAAEKPTAVSSSAMGVNSSSSGDKDKDKETTQEIELSAVGTDGHAVVVQTEEHSSKSLFGSDSQGDNRSDDEDSSTQVRSDHPLYVSSSEAEVITKNGVKCKGGGGGGSGVSGGNNSSATTTPETASLKRRGNGTEPLVSSNDSKYHHEQHLNRLASDSERDSEHIQIVVTEDSGTMIVPNNNKPGSGQLKTGLKNKLLSVSKEVLHRSDSDKSTTGPSRRSIVNPLKHVNPFKKDRDKARTSQKAKRFDQREVRATIRMAIIIAFFCGCWLGFFIIYVVTAFCPTCKVPVNLYAFIFWLGYSNSAMNPILYTIFNDDFRKAFQKLLGCHTRSPGGSNAGRTKH